MEQETKLTLFSTNCPKCRVLEQKLKDMGMEYELNTNVDEMVALGLKEAPVLMIGDTLLLDFTEAIGFLNSEKDKRMDGLAKGLTEEKEGN